MKTMTKLKILSVLAATLLSTQTLANQETRERIKEGTLEINPKRTLFVDGPITSQTIYSVNGILDLKGTDPIYFVINSPGGSVLAGMQVLTMMRILKSRGVELHCVVPMMAASMAFQMLAECTHRYAFEYSLLLWHPIRINARNISLTPKLARDLARDMTRYEKPMVEVLLRELGIDKKVFYRHYYNETLHLGGGLKKIAPGFLTIIEDIKGIKNPFSMRR